MADKPDETFYRQVWKLKTGTIKVEIKLDRPIPPEIMAQVAPFADLAKRLEAALQKADKEVPGSVRNYWHNPPLIDTGRHEETHRA